MPAVVFQEQSTATVKIGSRDQLGATAQGGPQAFPPPPPPPPSPLTIKKIRVSPLDPSYLEWQFNEPFVLESTPPTWTSPQHVGIVPGAVDILNSVGAGCVEQNAPSLVAGNHVVVPADMPGFKSTTGGSVTPGSYVVAAS